MCLEEEDRMEDIAYTVVRIIVVLAAAGGLGLLVALVLIHAGADREEG